MVQALLNVVQKTCDCVQCLGASFLVGSPPVLCLLIHEVARLHATGAGVACEEVKVDVDDFAFGVNLFCAVLAVGFDFLEGSGR